jgi:thiol-disulfide isomerase/thioredoxin
LIMLLAFGALGCFSAPKSKSRPAAQPTSTSPTNNVPFWKQTDPKSPAAPLAIPGPGGNAPARPTAAEQASYSSGVLAGTLVDAFGQRVQRAYVQVAAADRDAGAPIEVAVSDGYFTIPGLTPGRPYMLTARTSGEAERKLAGRLQATPPQPRLVIKMSEDLYSPSIPGVPSHAGETIPSRGTGGVKGDSALDGSPPMPPLPDSPLPERARGDDGWRHNANPDPVPGSGLSAPPGGNPPPPPLDEPRIPPTPPFNAENIADGDRDRDPRRPPAPLINLPNTGALPEPDPPPSGASGGPGAFRFANPAHVPSCEFSGRRLVNFALNDLSGRPWEFNQHHGRLVLLDFWGTWCMPCMRAIPHLKRLQSDYGSYGLEVIGIACERTPEPQRTRKVRDVVDRQQINYRVVLGESYEECPVQQKFRITQYPTLILLDASGNILWRGDAGGLNQLERTIQQYLRAGN